MNNLDFRCLTRCEIARYDCCEKYGPDRRGEPTEISRCDRMQLRSHQWREHISGSGSNCDACGDREAPGLMPLVRALREEAEYTITVRGASFEHDAAAWTCPWCGREWETSPSDSWHVVDVTRGRPVCEQCERGERFQALSVLCKRLVVALSQREV